MLKVGGIRQVDKTRFAGSNPAQHYVGLVGRQTPSGWWRVTTAATTLASTSPECE